MTDLYPLAFSTLGCPDWTLEQAAEHAAAAGYRALEIRTLDREIIPADLSPDQRRRVKHVMQQHGLSIIALGLSTRFSAVDAAEREKNVADLKRYIELANDLGAPYVRIFGGNVMEGGAIEQTIGWVAAGIAAALPAAEQQGVTILLETHDAFCRGAEVAQVLGKVPHDRLKAVWDVHHPFRMGESIEETWRLIGARTAHVHMKDARRRADGSWQLVLLGQGEVPCRAVVELLHRNHYRGYITAEWEKKWHPEIEPPEVALPQHAEVLRAWFADLTESA
ncbi:MAG: sugar phosphate isomerase/epimerase [Caldilineaceae bacterium]|nr:sugar phosphate isomerase/epimerase [Caldilineaceae bacterium]